MTMALACGCWIIREEDKLCMLNIFANLSCEIELIMGMHHA